MTKDQLNVYNSGYKCRDNFGGTHKCEYGIARLELRHYWLAGWHDSDMSHGVRMFNF